MFKSFNLKRNSWSDIEVSIIVSTGRTGTKFFYSIANQIQECLAKHEPNPIGNVEGAKFLRGDINEKELKSFLLNARAGIRKELRSNSSQNYFESNGGLTFYVDMLHHIFPKVRIAHIIRDPRDFVRSGCSRVDSSGNRIYLEDKNWLFKSTDLKHDKYSSKWENMRMEEKFMWIWNLKNEYVDNAVKKYSHIKTFRFEDLMKGNQVKAEMLDFLMFNRFETQINNSLQNKEQQNFNATTSFLYPEYANWSPQVKDNLKLHCGDLMNKFGYAL